ncbi:hypothetical protein HMF7854_04370 [Sphingomonas ginkgonis]|uniref:Uncharacterized protein n=1 Tax=Sphingomonas ginkgonis TaxID=2315330 RepID=A0A429V897_9SPHN|nr:hypothetical protein [Sphingomonas ginkgonis]RST30144.1 hypothetical protein HMF7854_04370 [Sphingomonas ginkgonis]
MAAAQRALRKGRVETVARWKHKNEGTPETHEHASHRRQGALARLFQSGGIDAEQLGSAMEIAAVAERIGGEVAVKTASLETRVDVTHMGDGAFYERLGQVRREMAYTRWRGALQRSGCQVAAVLDMIIGEPLGITAAAKRYRIHHRTARTMLITALDLWPIMLREICREVDQRELTRAHQRLAG